jgi:hypothetical protein
MASNYTVRQPNVIKNIIAPVSATTKTKIASAVQEFINRIKDKHL